MTDESKAERTTESAHLAAPGTASAAPDPALGSASAPDPDSTARPEPSGSRRALDLLAQQLTERGLRSSLLRDTLLLALNPAVAPESGPMPACSPGLQQLIGCLTMDGTEGLWFWWVWSITDDYTPVEFGPLCQATEIDRAAERIAHVLAVRDEPAAADGHGDGHGDGAAVAATDLP